MSGPLIDSRQIDAASNALGRAFYDDPLQKYFLPDDDERRTLSAPFFAVLIRYGHLFGNVYTNGTGDGAAVWLPPGATDMTDEGLSRAGMDDVAPAIGDEALGRFGGVMAFLEPFHKRDAAGPHWYLAVIGVDPRLQGQGVGQAMIRPVLARSDADGVPCYLETANGGNVQFYQHLGFSVLVDIVDPASKLRLWTFRREPGA